MNQNKKRAFVLLIPLGNIFGLQNSDIGFVIAMRSSHEFNITWYYKSFWTEQFADVMRSKNNLSIYELLGT